MQGSARQAHARANAQQDADMGRADAKRSRGAAAEEQPSTPSKRFKTEPTPAGKRQVGMTCHPNLMQQSCRRPRQGYLGGWAAPGCQHGERNITLLGLPRLALACVKSFHLKATSTRPP